jgi:hypothetical protein
MKDHLMKLSVTDKRIIVAALRDAASNFRDLARSKYGDDKTRTEMLAVRSTELANAFGREIRTQGPR